MKTLKTFCFSLALLVASVFFSLSAVSVYADTVTTPVQVNTDCNNPNPAGIQNCLKHNKLIQDLNVIIDVLSAGVGVVVVGSIILGGIQYSMAGGSPDGVSKAKQRIINAIIGLVAFIFIFAFLQWLIPGGI